MDFAEAHFRMGACYLFNGQWDLVVEEVQHLHSNVFSDLHTLAVPRDYSMRRRLSISFLHTWVATSTSADNEQLYTLPGCSDCDDSAPVYLCACTLRTALLCLLQVCPDDHGRDQSSCQKLRNATQIQPQPFESQLLSRNAVLRTGA